MQFAGESLVTDAYGNLICKAGDEEGGLYAEVDLKESSDLRNKKPYTAETHRRLSLIVQHLRNKVEWMGNLIFRTCSLRAMMETIE